MEQKALLQRWSLEGEMTNVLWRKRKKITSMRTGVYFFNITMSDFARNKTHQIFLYIVKTSDEEDSESASAPRPKKLRPQPTVTNGSAASQSSIRYVKFKIVTPTKLFVKC